MTQFGRRASGGQVSSFHEMEAQKDFERTIVRE